MRSCLNEDDPHIKKKKKIIIIITATFLSLFRLYHQNLIEKLCSAPKKVHVNRKYLLYMWVFK